MKQGKWIQNHRAKHIEIKTIQNPDKLNNWILNSNSTYQKPFHFVDESLYSKYTNPCLSIYFSEGISLNSNDKSIFSFQKFEFSSKGSLVLKNEMINKKSNRKYRKLDV